MNNASQASEMSEQRQVTRENDDLKWDEWTISSHTRN
jgi:hypothetical protein